MLIANPIYDTVFKYLLDDLDVAKGFLGVILGEEIIALEVGSQETTLELRNQAIHVFRLDFKAIIKTAEGENRKVLIELQKAKHSLDIIRFRRYLAANYQEEDTITLKNGKEESVSLPIVTIYLLGFKLAFGYPAVFKMNHQITDMLTGDVLLSRPREPFVELLHHESYTIQIPLLQDKTQTRLEQVLLVFNQKYLATDPHKLMYEGEPTDPLVRKMVERLIRAIADDELRRRMDVEDEVERTILKLLREKDIVIEEKDAVIQEKDAALQEKDTALQEKDAALQEKDAALQEKEDELARHKALIDELMKRLQDGDNGS